ncbi:MAG: glutathione S-transferase family protein [Betaproteobacteria bacterium]|nr:MAG: glutathione S-transferase family protein [Betaproteobacteria bacterium]
MIDLYFAPTGNGLRATVALEEAGLPYQIHRLDLYKGEQHSPGFLKINPAGLIPVIVDPDGPGGKPLILNQSGAIVLYCAEKSGRFIPADAATRALAMQYFVQAASDISGASMTIFRLEVTAPEKSTANVDYFKKRLKDAFLVCEQALQGNEYLVGELSVADLMLYPSFALRRSLVEDDEAYSNLHRWADNMASRPSVQRGMAYAG